MKRISFVDKDEVFNEIQDVITASSIEDLSLEYSEEPSCDSLFQHHHRHNSSSSIESEIIYSPTTIPAPRITSLTKQQQQLSYKKVAILAQKSYCILSNKPWHVLFFQVSVEC